MPNGTLVTQHGPGGPTTNVGSGITTLPQGGTATNPSGMSAGGLQAPSWEQLLAEFYAELNRPLDMKDPRVAAILNGAYGRSQADATARGIGGPLAVSGAQQSYIGAAAGLDQNRRAMGLQALQTGMQSAIANRGLALQGANQQWNADFQRWLAQAQLGQAQNSGWGAGVGGVLGGAIGGVGGFALGGPAGAATGAAGGWQAGSQIGAGIGGAGYNPGAPPAYSPKPSVGLPSNRVI